MAKRLNKHNITVLLLQLGDSKMTLPNTAVLLLRDNRNISNEMATKQRSQAVRLAIRSCHACLLCFAIIQNQIVML